MSRSKLILLGVVVVVMIIVGTAAFTVNESEQVVVVQFGKVVRTISDPGLHFKIPVIQEARRFEKRWLEWDGDPNQITTRDKRYIYIDVFARWRIVDPRVFIEKLRDEISAQGRLDDIIDNATRNVVANHNLIEAIRTTNREFVEADEEAALTGKMFGSSDSAQADSAGKTEGEEKPADDNTPTTKEDTSAAVPAAPAAEASKPAPAAPMIDSKKQTESLYHVTQGRKRLTRLILEKASAKTLEMGIELKDVQIKRINYIESVQAKVFDRMISERKRVAEAFRSLGQGRYAEIVGRMDKDLKQIRSEAYRRAQETMGKADAEAANIYAEAYQQDPELYRFLKTMESYGQTVDDTSWLLLTTDSDYARHLRTQKGRVN